MRFIVVFVAARSFTTHHPLCASCLISEQMELFLKGQTDSLQEENEVSEDPDLVVDAEGKEGPRVCLRRCLYVRYISSYRSCGRSNFMVVARKN